MMTVQDLHKKDTSTGKILTYEQWKIKIREASLLEWIVLDEDAKKKYSGEFENYHEREWAAIAVNLEEQYENVNKQGVTMGSMY